MDHEQDYQGVMSYGTPNSAMLEGQGMLDAHMSMSDGLAALGGSQNLMIVSQSMRSPAGYTPAATPPQQQVQASQPSQIAPVLAPVSAVVTSHPGTRFIIMLEVGMIQMPMCDTVVIKVVQEWCAFVGVDLRNTKLS